MMSEADRAAGRGIGGAQRVRLALYPITCAVLLLVYVLAVESDLLPQISGKLHNTSCAILLDWQAVAVAWPVIQKHS